jgi:hypothetical protein
MGTSKTKGTPQVGIEFEFYPTETGEPERIWWVGYLTEKAIENTIKTLAICGHNGDESFPAGCFSTEQVEIVIEMETYEGKTTPRVRWVNQLGASKFSNIQPDEAKKIATSVNLKAQVMAAKQKLGITTTAPTEKAPF